MSNLLKIYNYNTYTIELTSDDNSYLNIIITNNFNTKYQIKLTNDNLVNVKLHDLIYDIFPNCFNSINNYYKPNKFYSFDILLEHDCLVMDFSVKFNSFCQTNETIRLKEINYSNNQLITNKINELEKHIKNLNDSVITLGFSVSTRGQFLNINKNIDTIKYIDWCNYIFLHPIWILNEFKNASIIILNKQSTITFNTLNSGFGNTAPNNISEYIYSYISSCTYCHVSRGKNPYEICSTIIYSNVFDHWLVYLPNIKKLIYNYSDGENLANNTFINSLPNLQEVEIHESSNNKNQEIIGLLGFIEMNKTIKKIKILGTTNLKEKENIISYCASIGMHFENILSNETS